MRVEIATDERYPDYFLVDDLDIDDEDAVEVDAETVARWQEAVGNYNQAQSEMAAVLRRARNGAAS